MLLKCTNKGCYADGEHLLDETKNEVNCVECGEPIEVPNTTKTILKSLRQVQRKVKSGVQFTCKECGQTDKPLLRNMAGNITKAICRHCDAELDVHPSFIQAMKVMKDEYITRGDDDRGERA